MMENNWQRQVNMDNAQSKHLLPTASTPSGEVTSSEQQQQQQQQQQMHNFFGRSTKRPISAPPTSNDRQEMNVMNGMGGNNHGFSSSTSHETWGDTSLYRSATRDDSSTNDSKQQFHLSSHFNFDHLQQQQQQQQQGKTTHKRSETMSESSTSQQMNRMGSESVPPGLGLFPSEKTRTVSPNQSLYESTFDVMQIGSRRPASTGVIGHNHRTSTSSSVMESLGLIPSDGGSKRKQKLMMDLIQEDFPKTPSPEYQNETVIINNNNNNNNNHHLSSSNRDISPPRSFPSQSSFHTPASTSQPVTTLQYNGQNQSDAPLPMGPQAELNFRSGGNNFDNKNTAKHHHVHPNLPTELPSRAPHGFHQQDMNATTQNHYVSRLQGSYQTQVPQGVQSIPNGNTIHPHHHVIHQQATYQHQPQPQQVYYGTQRRNEVVSGPPRILQTAPPNTQQQIYVNSAPYGGYATVQYHQGPPANFHHPSPVIIHSHDPSMTSRYISAMPVQGPIPAQVPAQVPANSGAFIYFHQPPANNQTINIVPTTNQPRTRNQYGASKNTNDRTRKNNRTKKTGSNNVGSTENNSASASSVLEEFRAEKNRSWTAFDVEGHIVEFCQDQNGSRFIQQRLEVANEEEKLLIMSDILPDIQKLRVDIFGNYVVQKLFDFGTPEMIERAKQTIVGDMLTLSNQIYGCRVVQKALEIVNDDALLELLSELHGNVLSCIHDQNGNHVIQKCIEVLNKRAIENESKGNVEMARLFKQETQSILDCITEDIFALSCHPYGCRVFQRILEHFDETQKDIVLDCIGNFHQQLLDDQYGNYVIQHVLRFGRTCDRNSILDIVVKNGLLHLSRQKFASNVVEKLLKYGSDHHRKAIVREMLKVVQVSDMDGSTDQSTVVLMMVRDAYANYVVQTTLDVVPVGEEKRLLFEELNKHADALRNFTFAKHIITKLGTS